MSNSIVAKTETISDNPFDSIRYLDDQGNEFWYARDLQSLLGYLKWDRFTGVIEKATISFETNPIGAIDDHIIASEKMVKRSQGGGSTLSDFKLSRYFCYLVAMNGDVRKPEIASAQAYFAIKTRQAEVVIPEISESLSLAVLENENLKLENENLKLKIQLQGNSQFILDTHGPSMLALIQGRPEVVVEKIEKITETIVCKDGRNVSFEGKSLADMARELGFKSGPQLELWLKRQKADHLICQGMRAVQAPYIPTENISEVNRLWSNKKSRDRQLLLGE
jgi:DNA-damage-inducible protein D